MDVVTDILNGLKIERLDHLLFRGKPNEWSDRHVFGGHVVAQAMDAASQTVDDGYVLHSLHCYFLRPGKAGQDIIYDVDPIREGRSFFTRRVVAIQDGKAIFSVSFNYHKPEPGLEHQIDMPSVPQPEELDDDESYFKQYLRSAGADERRAPALPFEMRTIDRVDLANPKPKDPIGGYWMRLKSPLPNEYSNDPLVHARLLAYQSDFAFIVAALRPHALPAQDPRMKTLASLDHTMWLHTLNFRVDDWIFYRTEGYWAGAGRGLSRGALYTRDGRLIASTAQEGLMRLTPDAL